MRKALLWHNYFCCSVVAYMSALKRMRGGTAKYEAHLTTISLATALIVASAPTVSGQSFLAKPLITKLPSGATRVVNPGPTRWADTNGWKLVLERTVQPAEGEPGVLDNPDEARLASDGRLVTADIKNPAIRVYSAQGKFLRAIGRAGEGPGEYRLPFLELDHDTVFIHDPRLRRVMVFTLDGTLVRSITTATNDYFPLHFDARGLMALRASVRTPSGFKGQWIYHTRMGAKVDSFAALGRLDTKTWTVASPEGPQPWPVPFPPSNVELLLPTGGALVGRSDEYSFVITRTGHDTVRQFTRSNPPQLRIPDAARDSALLAEAKWRPQLKTIAKVSDLPTTYPLWRTLQVDGEGNIWVGARTEQGGRSRFDIFRPDGVFLGSVAAPFGMSSKVNIQGNRITVIDTDQDELPRVRVFRIDRRGISAR